MAYTSQIFPTSHKTQPRKVTLLSIIDASVVRFSPCSAYWIYTANPSTPSDLASLIAVFTIALARVLDAYPHFAGQVQYATDLSETDILAAEISSRCHVKRRSGRPVVVYHDEHDPGVTFRAVQSDRTISELLSLSREANTSGQDKLTTDFPIQELEHPGPLALDKLTQYRNLPAAAMQLTRFRCGGFALSCKTAHCLADATSLVDLMSNFSRAIRGESVLPPVFQPWLLDEQAGELLRLEPNADLIAQARSLALHRFDWFGEEPDWMTRSANQILKPEGWDSEVQSLGTRMPWESWDTSAAVDRVEISFTRGECEVLKTRALATLPGESTGVTVSRLDAVLAHVWVLVQRARNEHARAASSETKSLAEDDDDEIVHLNTTIGLRARLTLPESFLGSPILLTHTSLSKRTLLSSQNLGLIASQIRSTTNQLTPSNIKAHLHDLTYEPSPLRFWQAFLGSRHLLFTSWMRLPVSDVKIFGDEKPVLARGVMPLIDGLLQTSDSIEGGLIVNLASRKEVMRGVLDDPELHPQ